MGRGLGASTRDTQASTLLDAPASGRAVDWPPPFSTLARALPSAESPRSGGCDYWGPDPTSSTWDAPGRRSSRQGVRIRHPREVARTWHHGLPVVQLPQALLAATEHLGHNTLRLALARAEFPPPPFPALNDCEPGGGSPGKPCRTPGDQCPPAAAGRLREPVGDRLRPPLRAIPCPPCPSPTSASAAGARTCCGGRRCWSWSSTARDAHPHPRPARGGPAPSCGSSSPRVHGHQVLLGGGPPRAGGGDRRLAPTTGGDFMISRHGGLPPGEDRMRSGGSRRSYLWSPPWISQTQEQLSAAVPPGSARPRCGGLHAGGAHVRHRRPERGEGRGARRRARRAGLLRGGETSPTPMRSTLPWPPPPRPRADCAWRSAAPASAGRSA